MNGGIGPAQVQSIAAGGNFARDVVADVAIIRSPPAADISVVVIGRIGIDPDGRHHRGPRNYTRKPCPINRDIGTAINPHHVQVGADDIDPSRHGYVQGPAGCLRGSAGQGKSRGIGHIPHSFSGPGTKLADVLLIGAIGGGSGTIGGALDTIHGIGRGNTQNKKQKNSGEKIQREKLKSVFSWIVEFQLNSIWDKSGLFFSPPRSDKFS